MYLRSTAAFMETRDRSWTQTVLYTLHYADVGYQPRTSPPRSKHRPHRVERLDPCEMNVTWKSCFPVNGPVIKWFRNGVETRYQYFSQRLATIDWAKKIDPNRIMLVDRSEIKILRTSGIDLSSRSLKTVCVRRGWRHCFFCSGWLPFGANWRVEGSSTAPWLSLCLCIWSLPVHLVHLLRVIALRCPNILHVWNRHNGAMTAGPREIQSQSLDESQGTAIIAMVTEQFLMFWPLPTTLCAAHGVLPSLSVSPGYRCLLAASGLSTLKPKRLPWSQITKVGESQGGSVTTTKSHPASDNCKKWFQHVLTLKSAKAHVSGAVTS